MSHTQDHLFTRINGPACAACGAAGGLYLFAHVPAGVAAIAAMLFAVSIAASPLRRGARGRTVVLACAAVAAGLVLGASIRTGRTVVAAQRYLPVDHSAVVAAKGTLSEDTREGSYGWYGTMEVNEVETRSGHYSARLVLPVYDLDAHRRAGTSLEVDGFIGEGERGLYLSADEATVVADGRSVRGPLIAVAGLAERIETGVSELGAASGLSRALLLGQREGVSARSRELFRRSGTAHILALSGMHLGILIALAVLLLTPLLGRRAALVGALALCAVYLVVVGFRASLARAALMFALATTAVLLDRPPEPLRILAGAFLIMVCLAPGAVDGLSFQLSFAALLGILVIGRQLDRALLPWIPGVLRSPLVASVGAQVATLPLVVAVFGVARPVGVAATLVMAPLAVVFVWMSLLGVVLMLSGASAIAGSLVVPMLEALEEALVVAAERFAAVPGVVLPVTSVPLLGVGVGVCLLLAVFPGLLVASARHIRGSGSDRELVGRGAS